MQSPDDGWFNSTPSMDDINNPEFYAVAQQQQQQLGRVVNMNNTTTSPHLSSYQFAHRPLLQQQWMVQLQGNVNRVPQQRSQRPQKRMVNAVLNDGNNDNLPSYQIVPSSNVGRSDCNNNYVVIHPNNQSAGAVMNYQNNTSNSYGSVPATRTDRRSVASVPCIINRQYHLSSQTPSLTNVDQNREANMVQLNNGSCHNLSSQSQFLTSSPSVSCGSASPLSSGGVGYDRSFYPQIYLEENEANPVQLITESFNELSCQTKFHSASSSSPSAATPTPSLSNRSAGCCRNVDRRTLVEEKEVNPVQSKTLGEYKQQHDKACSYGSAHRHHPYHRPSRFMKDAEEKEREKLEKEKENKKWEEKDIDDEELRLMLKFFWKNLPDPLPEWYLQIRRE